MEQGIDVKVLVYNPLVSFLGLWKEEMVKSGTFVMEHRIIDTGCVVLNFVLVFIMLRFMGLLPLV